MKRVGWISWLEDFHGAGVHSDPGPMQVSRGLSPVSLQTARTNLAFKCRALILIMAYYCPGCSGVQYRNKLRGKVSARIFK